MSLPTFDEMWATAMGHMQGERYAAVEAQLAGQEQRFPVYGHWIYYLRACAAARLAQPEQAVALLEEAYEAGYWYNEPTLRQSPSFASLQGFPAFEALIAPFTARQEAMEAQSPPCLFVQEAEGEARGLLLALHGNGEAGEAALEAWQPAVAEGWSLAVAQSSQITSPNAYVWNDKERALAELQQHLVSLDKRVGATSPLLLTGFSMGGEIALEAALKGLVPAQGVLLVGPGGPLLDDPAQLAPLLAENTPDGLRVYILMGNGDGAIQPAALREVAEHLNAAGVPCQTREYECEGHVFPLPFAPLFQEAMAFLFPDR